MAQALAQAKIAFDMGEVPVGCVIVANEEIIAMGHNQVETLGDATAHAELLALQEAASVMGNWRLNGCTVYTSLEPCSMCAGAILLSRPSRLVWGAPDLRHGANGSFVDLFVNHPTHSLEITSGVLEEESRNLMQTFFKRRRCKSSLMN